MAETADSLALHVLLVRETSVLLAENEATGYLECVSGYQRRDEAISDAAQRIVLQTCGAQCRDIKVLAPTPSRDGHFSIVRAEYVSTPGKDLDQRPEDLVRQYLQGNLRWDWYPIKSLDKYPCDASLKSALSAM